MKFSSRLKPISYVKANAAEQETLALLKILALGRRHVEEGRAIPLAEATRKQTPIRKKPPAPPDRVGGRFPR